MDKFLISSDGKIFTYNKYDETNRDTDIIADKWTKTGTAIYMSLSNYSNKRAMDIFNSFSSVEGGFSRTSIPLRNIYDTPPVARSQAKRLAYRLDDFEEVVLDFEDIEAIGQGFAHELFKVFASEHPQTALIPINANENVQKMIKHVGV